MPSARCTRGGHDKFWPRRHIFVVDTLLYGTQLRPRAQPLAQIYRVSRPVNRYRREVPVRGLVVDREQVKVPSLVGNLFDPPCNVDAIGHCHE